MIRRIAAMCVSVLAAMSLGAVYDGDHVVGIMALNLKTCGGYETSHGSNRGNVAVAIGTWDYVGKACKICVQGETWQ